MINYKEILKENWSLYDIAELFMEFYPKDIFITKPEPIVKIREGFEEILKIRDENKE